MEHEVQVGLSLDLSMLYFSGERGADKGSLPTPIGTIAMRQNSHSPIGMLHESSWHQYLWPTRGLRTKPLGQRFVVDTSCFHATTGWDS